MRQNRNFQQGKLNRNNPIIFGLRRGLFLSLFTGILLANFQNCANSKQASTSGTSLGSRSGLAGDTEGDNGPSIRDGGIVYRGVDILVTTSQMAAIEIYGSDFGTDKSKVSVIIECQGLPPYVDSDPSVVLHNQVNAHFPLPTSQVACTAKVKVGDSESNSEEFLGTVVPKSDPLPEGFPQSPSCRAMVGSVILNSSSSSTVVSSYCLCVRCGFISQYEASYQGASITETNLYQCSAFGQVGVLAMNSPQCAAISHK